VDSFPHSDAEFLIVDDQPCSVRSLSRALDIRMLGIEGYCLLEALGGSRSVGAGAFLSVEGSLTAQQRETACSADSLV
jgi:hypothetical protein